MNEVIASILDAEKKAEEIVKLSTEKAKTIRISAEEDGEKIKNGAVAVFKLHRAAAIKSAEKRAEEQYAAIIEEGERSAAEIAKQTAAETDYYAEQIVKGITD